MKLSKLRPALLNFIAGVCAGAAINILTSAATNFASMTIEAQKSTIEACGKSADQNFVLQVFTWICTLDPQYKLLLMAIPWFGISFMIALLAADLEDARHEADFTITRNLSQREIEAIYEAKIDPLRKRANFFLSLSGSLFIIAILLQILAF